MGRGVFVTGVSPSETCEKQGAKCIRIEGIVLRCGRGVWVLAMGLLTNGGAVSGPHGEEDHRHS